MPIITIANHKGGVGKTSNAVNIAAYLTNHYKKGLLLDFDPQADCSRMFYDMSDKAVVKIHQLFSFAVENNIDFEVQSEARNQFDEMAEKATIIKSFGGGTVSLIASGLDLTRTKMSLASIERLTNFILPPMVRYLARNYDYVIIDTPPSIELLTFTAVVAADYIIIPIEVEATSVRGARDIIEHVLGIANRYYSSKADILGIVINKYTTKTNLSRELEPIIQRDFGDYLFETKISTSVRLQELSVLRTTLNKASKGSRSDQEYKKLTQEIFKRIKGREK